MICEVLISGAQCNILPRKEGLVGGWIYDPVLGARPRRKGQEPKNLFPPPTSGLPQVEENTEKYRITKNSLVAEIRGWG